jgi:hypothetical protein
MKPKKDRVITMDLAKNHLNYSTHKLKYLAKYFPTIKKIRLDGSKVDHNMTSIIVDRVLNRNLPMKIKIVIGQKLFKRKSQEIKTIIENSTHFV